MEPHIIDFYNEMPHMVNVIDKMNEELAVAQTRIKQLELQLNKTVDATPEQINEWQEKELNWWAEIQLPLVAFMAFVQLAVFGGMLLTMILIGEGFK